MKHKKTSGFHAAAFIFFAGLLLISVNFCASQLTRYLGLRLDLTDNELYQVSQETKDILTNLKAPIQIQVLSRQGDFLPLVDELLQEYKRIGKDKIQLSYVDPYTHPALLDEYLQQGLQVDIGSVVVRGEMYSRVIRLEEMFQLDSRQQSVESLRCEPMLTGAILHAAGDRIPRVIFTAGHNEVITDGLRELFLQNNYEISYIALEMAVIPEDTDLLVIASPSIDFSDDEMEQLDAFLAGGGRVMVFLGSGRDSLTNFFGFLEEWGIAPTGTVVAEILQYVDGEPSHIVPIYSAHDITQYFADNQIYLVMPSSQALKQVFVSRGGIRTQKILYSTDRAYPLGGGQEKGAPYTLAMTAEKELEADKARIFVAGSRHIYDDNLLHQGHYSNGKFISRAMSWCTERDSSISIPPKRLHDVSIAVTTHQVMVIALLLVVFLPMSVLIYGVVLYHRRRHS